jgi:aminoglycoside phosphotransferase (APT) family kinase protein
MCRRLAGFERFEGQNLRYRRSTATLVRYKPERRAVVKFAAATRAPDRTLAFQTLGLRVLPRAHAVRTARARTVSGLESLGIAPRLVGHEERTGIVVEEWLDVVPNAHDDFQGAGEAAMALARLHALPCMVSPPPSREEDARSMLALFEVQRSAWTAARSILAVPPRAEFRVAWIHGDFHPDQTAHEPRTGFTRVLDWDGLASGDPLVDVASWVADAVACEDARAEAEFVHGYRTHGGAAFTDSELNRAVARALCARAGAVLRRLEKDALGRTARILDAALARLDLRGAVR